MIDVRAPRRPRVEVDRAQVRGPGHVRDLGHAELVGVAAGREGDARDLDPVGPLLGHALLVDRLALRAAGMALQLRGPLVERAHDPLADGDVVLDVVELRLAALGEVDLVGVRHLDGAAADLQLDERRGHARVFHPSGACPCAGRSGRWVCRLPPHTPAPCGARHELRPFDRFSGGSSRFRGRDLGYPEPPRRSGRVAEGGALLRR